MLDRLPHKTAMLSCLQPSTNPAASSSMSPTSRRVDNNCHLSPKLRYQHSPLRSLLDGYRVNPITTESNPFGYPEKRKCNGIETDPITGEVVIVIDYAIQ